MCDKPTAQKLYERNGWWQENAETSAPAPVLWALTSVSSDWVCSWIVLCAWGRTQLCAVVVGPCCHWAMLCSCLCCMGLRNGECGQEKHLQTHPLLGVEREIWPQGLFSPQSGTYRYFRNLESRPYPSSLCPKFNVVDFNPARVILPRWRFLGLRAVEERPVLEALSHLTSGPFSRCFKSVGPEP